MTEAAREARVKLWLLAAPPAIWAAHFLLAYGVGAIFCAKRGRDASLAPVQIFVAALTLVALAAIVSLGVRGRAHQRRGGAPPPHDRDTDVDRLRFLGFATVLLAGLSAVATLYSALAAAFVTTCR